MSTVVQPFEARATLRYRALLVDDEPLLRKVLARGLSRVGFQVVEATDGLRALALVENGAFDLVVSDVRMPVMGGVELLQALVVRQPGLPVVLMSGSDEVADRDSALDLGAFDFLSKPFATSELQRSALRAALSRQPSTAAKPPANQ
ncbi:MAG TPA: response regulator [Polyangiaceae bacterium]|nr:response regulator [Polyangiaceae bacterium]